MLRQKLAASQEPLWRCFTCPSQLAGGDQRKPEAQHAEVGGKVYNRYQRKPEAQHAEVEKFTTVVQPHTEKTDRVLDVGPDPCENEGASWCEHWWRSAGVGR